MIIKFSKIAVKITCIAFVFFILTPPVATTQAQSNTKTDAEIVHILTPEERAEMLRGQQERADAEAQAAGVLPDPKPVSNTGPTNGTDSTVGGGGTSATGATQNTQGTGSSIWDIMATQSGLNIPGTTGPIETRGGLNLGENVEFENVNTDPYQYTRMVSPNSSTESGGPTAGGPLFQSGFRPTNEAGTAGGNGGLFNTSAGSQAVSVSIQPCNGPGSTMKYQMLAPITGFLGDSQGFYNIECASGKSSLSVLLNSWFRIGIALAGLLAVVQIVIGGFLMATTDSLFNQEKGREKIKEALYGLGLALVSYLILNTINPALTRTEFAIKPAQLQGMAGAVGNTGALGVTGGAGTGFNGVEADPSYRPTLTPGGTLSGVEMTHYYASYTDENGVYHRDPNWDPDTEKRVSAIGETATPLRYTNEGGGVGSAAVDPSVYPLGTVFSVTNKSGNTDYYVATDVGGAVKGNHIDFFSKTPVDGTVQIVSVGNSSQYRSLTNAQRETYFQRSLYQK